MKQMPYRLLLSIFLLGFSLVPVEGHNSRSISRVAKLAQDDIVFGNHALININNMSMWFKDDGHSAGNPYSDNSGVTYPRSTNQVIYRDGLVWGGRVLDGDPQELRVGGSTYAQGTVPGRIISRGVADDRDDPRVRIYRVRRDYKTANLRLETSEYLDIDLSEVTDDQIEQLRAQYEKDWNEWPAEWGAPYYDNDGDGQYDPAVDEPGVANADQVAWYVVNDLDLGATQALYGAKPIGIEEQILIWAYARTDALGDAIFKKYTLVYKGHADTPDDARIVDMYFAQWSDPDLGDYGDDFVGSDIELSLGYVYNATGSDSHYDSFDMAPPAAGYDFLQGPIVPVYVEDEEGNQVPDENSVAIFNFQKLPGYRNLPMTAFVYFAAGSAIDDPELNEYNGTKEWYNLLRGYEPQPDIDNPQPYTNEVTGEVTTFTMSGDPVLARGWNDGVPLPAGDRRMVMATGPFEMALDDTQEVVVALLGGSGGDRLRSVSQLKFNDQFVQDAYNNLFEVLKPPAAPKVRAAELDGSILLDWGWDAGAVATTEGQNESGFLFEGYNVYQLPDPTASLNQGRRLATFDLENGVATILGIELHEESGVILDMPQQLGGDFGIRRYVKITQDAIRGGSLVNGEEYYFAVTAYSRNTAAGAAITNLESVPQIMIGVPRSLPPGKRYPVDAEEIVTADHTAGRSDGLVQFMVIDPTRITGNDYQVTFAQNADSQTIWSLTNNSTGQTLIANSTDQSGAGHYIAAEGFEIRVGGPPNGMKDWDIPTGERWWTWAAADWGAEGFGGAMTGDPNNQWFNETTLTPADLKTVELRFTSVHEEDGEDQYKPLGINNENVSYAYRYLRGAGGDVPALGDLTSTTNPYDWSKYIINAEGDGYAFQERVPVCLSAWDMESDPPRRLEIGFLENNHPGGLVNGAYGPAWYNVADNIAGDGPREWLFIFDLDYTDPNQGNSDILLNSGLYTEPLPHMWIIMANRRREDRFPQDGDSFLLIANRVNTAADEFTFTVPGMVDAPTADAGADRTVLVGEEVMLDGSGSYDTRELPLTYRWIPGQPNPSVVELDHPESMRATFTASATGPYTFFLVVNNGIADSHPQAVVVHVRAEALLGDVSGDGLIDSRDAFLVLRIINGLSLFTPPAGHIQPTPYERAAADVDQDGEITAADALLVMYLALGRVEKPVISSPLSEPILIGWGAGVREGDVLSVPLSVEEGISLGAGHFQIRYDSKGLTPLSVDPGVPGALLEFNSESPGQVRVALANPDGIAGAEGDVLLFHFKVDEERLEEGSLLLEQVRLFDASTSETGVRISDQTADFRLRPTAFALSQNFPNPFNPSTQINYRLPEVSYIRLAVYNLLGQEIRMLVEDTIEAGYHSISWNGRDNSGRSVGSGIYIIRLQAEGSVQVRKTVLMR